MTLVRGLLVLAIVGCSGQRYVSEPAKLEVPTDETDEAAIEVAKTPKIDWQGIPPNRRQDVLDVLATSFCPSCPCPQSVATCITPSESCDCRECSELLARWTLDMFRAGNTRAQVEDMAASAWSDSFTRAPFEFHTSVQPTNGPDGAAVQVVEFADFVCPHCSQLAPVLRALGETRPDVQIVFYFYPLQSYGPSLWAALAAAEAQAQGKFWTYSAELYRQSRPADVDRLTEIGTRLGLDGDAIRSAVETARHREIVMDNKGLGQKAGVQGTPAIFINGRPFTLPRTLPNLENWVDMERLRGQCPGPGSTDAIP